MLRIYAVFYCVVTAVETAVFVSLGLELIYTLIQGYRVKPHGQLVLVSLTYYYASTPSLSTWWSSTTL